MTFHPLKRPVGPIPGTCVPSESVHHYTRHLYTGLSLRRLRYDPGMTRAHAWLWRVEAA